MRISASGIRTPFHGKKAVWPQPSKQCPDQAGLENTKARACGPFAFSVAIPVQTGSCDPDILPDLKQLTDFVSALPHLQFIVIAKRHQKLECFGAHLLEPAVYDDALHAGSDDRLQIR